MNLCIGDALRNTKQIHEDNLIWVCQIWNLGRWSHYDAPKSSYILVHTKPSKTSATKLAYQRIWQQKLKKKDVKCIFPKNRK